MRKLMLKTTTRALYVKLPAHLIGFRFYHTDEIHYFPALNTTFTEIDQQKALEEFPELFEEVLRYAEDLPEQWAVYSCSVANSVVLPLMEEGQRQQQDEGGGDGAKELPPPSETCRDCPVYKRRDRFCWLNVSQLKASRTQAESFDSQFWESQYNSSTAY